MLTITERPSLHWGRFAGLTPNRNMILNEMKMRYLYIPLNLLQRIQPKASCQKHPDISKYYQGDSLPL